MKVLLVNGSPHQKGCTYTALSEVAEALHNEGIKTDIYWIGNKPIGGCIGCFQCAKKQKCVFEDKVNEFTALAAGYDGFIFGSPVYYGQPNGALLAVVQRMLMAGGSLMTNKPVANVAVCRRGGATATYQTMNMAFEMMNMPIVTSQYWNIVYGQKPGEAENDEEGMQTMRTMANNMAWLLKRIHQGGDPQYPEREAWTPMNFIR